MSLMGIRIDPDSLILNLKFSKIIISSLIATCSSSVEPCFNSLEFLQHVSFMSNHVSIMSQSCHQYNNVEHT